MSSLPFYIVKKDKAYLVVLLTIALDLAFALEHCLSLISGNDQCSCNPLIYSRGWELRCFDKGSLGSHFSMIYSIPGKIERNIVIDCSENLYDYEFFLKNVDDTRVSSYTFISCPLPKISYGSLINSSREFSIIIHHTKDKRNFTTEMFEGLPEKLKSLSFINNKIANLPESIFENLTELQKVSITLTPLKLLPEKIFQTLSKLTELDVRYNLLMYLSENIFDGLSQLKLLYMDFNRLNRLPQAIFKSLVNLEELYLSNNRLNSLSPDTFEGLSQLKILTISSNLLKSLPTELFSHTLNIVHIDLSSNNFIEPLPKTLIHNLTLLENLYLESCNITYIHENFFSYSPKLSNLKLGHNKIIELPGNIFHNNSDLKLINLNSNSIIFLSTDLLKNLISLETLSLNSNNISAIPESFFRNAEKLKYLELGENYIQYISLSMFDDFAKLETLNLRKNNLREFVLPFISHYNFKSIDLSYNNLIQFPEIPFRNVLNLQSLDLQYNKITYFEIPLVFSDSKQSPSINVAHNKIQTVDLSNAGINGELHYQSKPFYKISNTSIDTSPIFWRLLLANRVAVHLTIHSNPFLCDCRLHQFYDYIKQSKGTSKEWVRFETVEDLRCAEPLNHKGKSILNMEADEFICDVTENCSPLCHCYVRVYDNSTVVNCSGHELKQLPEKVPSNTNILHFEKNLLSSLQLFNEVRWDNLTEAYLDENQISTISNWKMPSSLRVLSVKQNRIRYLTEDFMNFTANAENFRVNLSGNLWTCNCSTKKFKRWLSENFLKIPDAFDILCSTKIKQNDSAVGMSVMSIPDDVICPPDKWPYTVQMTTIASVCVLLALSLFALSVLYYRNKQTVIAYMYVYMYPAFILCFGEEEFDKDKDFDAFVAYGHDDSDVAHKLVDELEPDFKLCIHERDWIAGHEIEWNIRNSVNSSRRTILVVSQQFLKSIWFAVELNTAWNQMLEEKIDRLIVIIKGDLPSKEDLSKEFPSAKLSTLLSTKTYLVWEERWFWEKLKCAMPHKKRELKSDALALKDIPESD